MSFRIILVAVCFFGVQTSSCEVTHAADTPADSLVSSDVLVVAGGEMVVVWYPGRPSRTLDLLIHFHGAVPVVTRNFEHARLDAVLVAVNFKGLSSAYAKPFRSSDLFRDLLDRTMSQLRESGRADEETKWGQICVSSFSAGYGAVREILKIPGHFDRIDGLLAADSIYAGLEAGDSVRRVNKHQMHDFLRFSRLASQDKKRFLLTHSYLQTPYASTRETADFLLDAIPIQREEVRRQDADFQRLVSRASRGGFTVLGYEGTTGAAHLQHLHHISQYWRKLPLRHLP